MNKLYKQILLNLMLIENETDPILRMLAYAKIGGIVEYALVKEDIEEEIAEKIMHAVVKAISLCKYQLNS